MLKARALTALLMLPLFLTALFYLPNDGWMVFVAFILLVAWDEWLRLTKIDGTPSRVLGSLIFIATLLALLWLKPVVWFVAIASLCLWLLILLATFFVQNGYLWSSSFRRLSGLLVLASAWWIICWLRVQWYGTWWTLGFLCIVWLADVGAYVAGKQFGKNKLAPAISPGKTIEGAIGGLLLVGLVTLAVHQLYPVLPIWWVLPMTILVAMVSIAGDLYESRLKRIGGFKDSGSILPGHGGILDRIDGVLVGLPVFVFVLLNMGVFSV
jgi:phosphatidate cytidylyltransferase